MPNQTTLKNLKRVLKKVEADLKRPIEEEVILETSISNETLTRRRVEELRGRASDAYTDYKRFVYFSGFATEKAGLVDKAQEIYRRIGLYDLAIEVKEKAELKEALPGQQISNSLKNLKRVLKKVEADLKRPAGIEECRERAYSRMDVFGKLHVLTGRVVDFLGLDFLSPLVNKRLAIVYNRVGKKALVDSQKYSNGANKEGASILYIPAKVEDPNKKKIEVKTIEDIEAMVENLKTEELEFTIEEKIAEIENDPTLQPAVKELYLEFARRIKCLDEELKIEGEK